jgi:type I restriction enzyme R subunit
MRQELVNLNSDLVKQYPDYVCRVTADEGAIGLTHLATFQDVDKPTPVILTTSQLLTTGVDAEMVKNVVLARVVGSRSEFKQISRAWHAPESRLRQGVLQHHRLHRHGHPALRRSGLRRRSGANRGSDIDEAGGKLQVKGTEAEVAAPQEDAVGYELTEEQIGPGTGIIITEPRRAAQVLHRRRRSRGHRPLVYDLDTDGKKLQVVKYTEYSGRAVRTLYPTREACNRPGPTPTPAAKCCAS